MQTEKKDSHSLWGVNKTTKVANVIDDFFNFRFFLIILMVTRNKTTKNTWNSAPKTIHYVAGEKL